MRQLGTISVPRASPKLTHGAELPTDHPVTSLALLHSHRRPAALVQILDLSVRTEDGKDTAGGLSIRSLHRQPAFARLAQFHLPEKEFPGARHNLHGRVA